MLPLMYATVFPQKTGEITEKVSFGHTGLGEEGSCCRRSKDADRPFFPIFPFSFTECKQEEG